MIIRVDNKVHLVDLGDIPGTVQNHIRSRLTFPNPTLLEAEKRGFRTGELEREIAGYRVEGDAMVIPRGFTRQLAGILHRGGVNYQIQDLRRTLPPVDFAFQGELHDFQAAAVRAMAARDFGTLSAPTGSGKTVMALALVARRRQPTLVVVHNRELLEQWINRIGAFLDIPPQEVGIIGEGKKRIGQKITVALVQSLYKYAGEVALHIGFLVVDECHQAPSRQGTRPGL